MYSSFNRCVIWTLGQKKDSKLLSFSLTANGTILFENDVKQFNRQASYNPAESIQDQIIGIKTSQFK